MSVCLLAAHTDLKWENGGREGGGNAPTQGKMNKNINTETQGCALELSGAEDIFALGK